MLNSYRDNSWMLNEHWPLNEPHVRLMIREVLSEFVPSPAVRILDVGCFNGYISIIFRELGFSVVGTDAYSTDEYQALLARAGVSFVPANFNDLRPFPELTSNSFHVVILAQVIEHVLNYPAGLLKRLEELLVQGGILILTTPNPANVMAALRLLKGKSILWGTRDFIDQPKIDRSEVITKADIHYREYNGSEISYMIKQAGLDLETKRYLGLGITGFQSRVKRAIKRNVITRSLMSNRLFGSNHFVVARKR
jgi:2-polyprenyl-3-methyl-5-hydroxy-6-metoxy-1,4-benzoquinol methylase